MRRGQLKELWELVNELIAIDGYDFLAGNENLKIRNLKFGWFRKFNLFETCYVYLQDDRNTSHESIGLTRRIWPILNNIKSNFFKMFRFPRYLIILFSILTFENVCVFLDSFVSIDVGTLLHIGSLSLSSLI